MKISSYSTHTVFSFPHTQFNTFWKKNSGVFISTHTVCWILDITKDQMWGGPCNPALLGLCASIFRGRPQELLTKGIVSYPNHWLSNNLTPVVLETLSGPYENSDERGLWWRMNGRRGIRKGKRYPSSNARSYALKDACMRERGTLKKRMWETKHQ